MKSLEYSEYNGLHKQYAKISKTYQTSRSKLKICKHLDLFLIIYLHWCNMITNKKYSYDQNNIKYLLYTHNTGSNHVFVASMMFICSNSCVVWGVVFIYFWILCLPRLAFPPYLLIMSEWVIIINHQMNKCAVISWYVDKMMMLMMMMMMMMMTPASC